MNTKKIPFSPPDVGAAEATGSYPDTSFRMDYHRTAYQGVRTGNRSILPYGESRVPELGDSLHGDDSPRTGRRSRR